MAARRMFSDAVKFIGAVEDEWQLYSDNASDYALGPPVGFGASSIVYQAVYRPPSGGSIPCALKVLDLDSLPTNSLRLLRRETQLMSLSKHPNVLRVRGTWMDGHKLFIALRLMRSGSVADVMQYGWPGGMEEEVVKCVLKQALEGLNYLHINNFIHRDVKAANLLIDDDGTVLLGDLGVAVALNDEDTAPAGGTTVTPNFMSSMAPIVNSGIRKRKSFVGTPCWMAPEVISQRNYDSKADIWSLGITALELAQGRAPRSREPPHKVLLRTIQDEPPTLDRDAGPYKYSKAFSEVIQSCLSKDPSKRPSAEELLQTAFFRSAKKKSYLVGALLDGLPPLLNRQERRRIPGALSRLSIGSWDFSQASMTSPSALVQPGLGILDDDVFEMEETRDAVESLRGDKQKTISTPHQPSMDSTEDSTLGESTDETPSTPSTSPPSSYASQSVAAPGPFTAKPTSVQPSAQPSLSPPNKCAPSPSSSPGLWGKLKRMGSRTPMDREKQQDESLTKTLKRLPSRPISKQGSTLYSRSPE